MLAMPREVVNIAKISSQNRVRSAAVKLQIARNSMTDVYTDIEYSATMLAVLAEHRGFAIRKMPLKFGTGGLKMAEYIEREATRKLFCEKCKGYYDGHCIHRGECDVDVIQTAPAADVQPVKRGRWIDLDGRILCSYCGSGYDDTNEVKINTYLFCPNCGADMHTQ